MTQTKATLTLITSEKPKILSKRLWIDDEGHLQKRPAAQMVEGRADRVSVSGLQGLADLLVQLKKSQSLAFGVTRHESIRLVTKKAFNDQGRPADRIPRTKEFFSYPAGPGGMFFDYDPEADAALSRDGLVEALRKSVQGLYDASFVWMPSGGSCIHNGDREIVGLRGQRLYILVNDASDIPRAAAAMKEYLWAAGYGYFTVGVAGQVLERCLLDQAVYQPNRLDFAAGAICEPPLHQERGEPVIIEGSTEYVDTASAIPAPSPDVIAAAKANREKARAAIMGEAQEVKERYISSKAMKIVGAGAEEQTIEEAKRTVRRAVEQNVLHGDHPIGVIENSQVTERMVGAVLDDPARFHGLLTLDPIEPEYDGGRAVGKLYLYGSKPVLFSFAHGGRSFKLLRQPAKIELAKGRTHDAVLKTIELIQKQPDMFDHGSTLALVENGRIYPIDEHGLKHELAGRVQYFSMKKSKQGDTYEVFEDPPAQVAKSILALGERRNLKKLDAAVDMPLIRPDGKILDIPGFDEQTRILLDIAEPAEIPAEPSIEDCAKALRQLLHPFRNFPFCGPVDMGVFLSAVLTASTRPTLDISPAFGIDAPVQGTGKTILAQCISQLSAESTPSVWPHTSARDDEEIRKRLFSALREGSRVILWDNLLGIVSSASLAAALTSPVFQDRVLGRSESQRVPNKALFLLTGNNICLAGDLPRRVFVMRMDPGMERPASRRFDLDPAAYCTENRQLMVNDAITVMRGACIHYHSPADGVGFPAWNELVRRAVLFSGEKLMPGVFGDPKSAIDDAQQSDPEQEELHAFLNFWHERFGDKRITAKEVIDSARFEFCEAISDLMADRAFTAKGLGKLLRFKKDRIVGGLVLKEAPSSKKMAKLWYVTKVPS